MFLTLSFLILLDIRERWTVNGSLRAEAKQPVELGLKDAPTTGLYIRQDVDMTCNILMTSVVKKTLKDSHAELVEMLKLRTQVPSQRAMRANNSTMTSGNTTAVEHTTPNNNDNQRNIHGLDRTAEGGNKNLAVYNWLNTQPQGGGLQHWHQCRSASNRSMESNGNSNFNTNLISPVSHTSPSYRKMVVSPPTPPYTPMASPLWTQLQPPSQPQTLASLSPAPPAPVLPNRPPPPRPPRPDEQNQYLKKKQKPALRLIPEPLRVPRTAVPVAAVQCYSPNQVIKPLNTSHLEMKNPPISHRKFSYDSTNSTENYLVPSLPLTTSSPVEVFKRLPPPQHILSQSRDYHQQAITINSATNSSVKPSVPSSPALEKLQRHMGKQFISFDPFEEHPDYPHMSPYMDDNFGEMGDQADDDEYEDVKVDDDDDDDVVEIDSYCHFNERDADISPREARQFQFRHREKKTKEQQEEDIIMNDDDSGYADYVITPPPPPPPLPTSKPPLPPMGIRVVNSEAEENQMVGATLSGPFVAAFDEFNICLP